MDKTRIDIEVAGMTCAACSTRVEKALNKREGVINAAVNLLAQKTTIEYDSDTLSPSDLVETIEKSGYDVPLMRRTLLVEGMT